MPVITYIAIDRGELASGHSATTQYQIECLLEGFSRTQARKGRIDETLSGSPEGWLDALQWEYDIQSSLVLPADIEDWREFISSVINGEEFQIDFTGTIASPGTDVDVWLVSNSVQERQIGGAGVKYTFKVKVQPS